MSASDVCYHLVANVKTPLNRQKQLEETKALFFCWGIETFCIVVHYYPLFHVYTTHPDNLLVCPTYLTDEGFWFCFNRLRGLVACRRLRHQNKPTWTAWMNPLFSFFDLLYLYIWNSSGELILHVLPSGYICVQVSVVFHFLHSFFLS